METRFEIISHSHRLADNCFAFFEENSTGLRFAPLADTAFSMTIDGNHLKKHGAADDLPTAHFVASSFLIALNIGTMGYFTWRMQPSLDPMYHVREKNKAESVRMISLLRDKPIDFGVIEEFSRKEIMNTAVIFGALLRDRESHPKADYLKGLVHICVSHFDIDFYREAFGNFYRALETTVTLRILKKKNLKNEVKDIQKALEEVGADEHLQAAFQNEIYPIRSSQVAHAQKQQIAIDINDVIKVKLLTDLVMYKTYLEQAELWRQESPMSAAPDHD